MNKEQIYKQKSFLSSSNFWAFGGIIAAAIAVITGLFDSTALDVVALLAAAKMVQTWFSNARFAPLQALKDSNWWGYLGTVAIGLGAGGGLTELLPFLQDAVTEGLAGNIQGVLMAVFAAVPIIIKLVRGAGNGGNEPKERASR